MKKTIFFIILLLFIESNVYSADKYYKILLENMYKKTVKLISPEDTRKIINNNNIYILDIRSEKEYRISHLKNAIPINYRFFTMKDVKNIPKDSKIIVYCSVGYRSERIGEKLLKAGYKDVQNLYGGIFEWINQGYDIYDSNGKTNKIHGYSWFWGKWITKGKIVY